MLFFSPDPSHDDIKDFMGADERDSWDYQKGTPEERAAMWKRLEEIWRSISGPTEAELERVMGPDCGHVQRGENRDQILTFYRRKWKKDRKSEAVARWEEAKRLHAPEPPNEAKQSEPPITEPEPSM